MLTSAFTQGLNLFLVGLTITETAYGALGIFTYSYLFDEVKDTHRTTVSSILSATKTLGGAASLLTLGEVADRFSPQVSFAVGGLAVLLVILFYAKLKA